MDDLPDEALGPIDYVVVEFARDKADFTGAMAKELTSLIDRNLIRVLDLILFHKNDDGSIDVVELEDLDQAGELGALEGTLAEIFAEEDLAHLAEAVEPGTTALALVWENTWAAPFAEAARHSGGQLVGSGRIPTQALMAALDPDNEGA